MIDKFRIVILENNPTDIELIEHELKGSGLNFISRTVQSEKEYLKALFEFAPDIILSDYDLPQFDGAEALKIAKEHRPEIPFILVTGAVGEDRAIEILIGGATDYVMKNRLSRLYPAVLRALTEAEEYKIRIQAEAERDLLLQQLESRVQARTAELEAEVERRRAAEERYRKIFDGAVEGIYQTTREGLILRANPALARMFGFSSPREMIDSVMDLGRQIYVDPDDRERMMTLVKHDNVEGFEAEVYRKDKSRFWMSINMHAVRDEAGNILCFEGTIIDITERKKAEAALRESEERFRSAFDKGAVPMTIAALDSRLIFVNAAFSKMLGYSEAELAEMSFFKITHPDDIAANQAGLAPVIRGEKDSFRMEKRYIRKDGRVIWADMSTSSVRDANGKPLYYVTYVQDTTERKLAEQALRESEEKYRQLVDSAPDAVIVHREGRFLYANALALKLYGAETLEQLRSKTVLDLIHPGYRDTVSERMKRVEAGQSVELKETAVVRFDGRVVPVESVASMMINYEGEPAIQVTIRDITERKRAEEAVRASTKKTETVLASITDMYVSYDNEWRFADLNPVAEKLMGKTREELVGKVLWEVFPQLRESEIHEHYLKAVRDKSTKSFEAYSPVTKHWHEFYLYPADDGLSVYLRDISDRKQMEEALRKSKDELEIKVQGRTHQLSEANKALLAEIDTSRRIAEELQKSEEAYRLLVELNPVGVYTLIDDPHTMQTKRLHCNEAHLRILGYASLQEWLAESTSVVFHSETNFKNFREHLLKDGKVINYKVRLRRRDGKAIWVLMNATARDYGGKILIESIMTDITSQKRIEERLRSAQNKLRAMASEIVLADERSRQHLATELHDTVLQTLGAAKMRSELLNQYIPEEGAAHYSELQNLLRKSIAQSRLIMSEMSPPVLYELGFVPALEWLTEQMKSQHDLAVNFETTEKGPQQLAHEVRVLLFQATRELLMNVAKHAKADSAVVKLSGNANHVKIEVIDKGAGFDTKQAFRTDISSGGFGLFSIRERLRHFGGELKIRSKPGEGTRVGMAAPRIIEK